MRRRWIWVRVLAVGLPACASIPRYRSEFLGNDVELQPGRYFRRQFIEPGTNFSRYDTVQVTPVELGYLKERARYKQRELNRLASKLHEALVSELITTHRILDERASPDAHTLIVSPALVSATWGSATFEAKLMDGATRLVLAGVAEKRRGRGVNLKSLVWDLSPRFSGSEVVFKRWAEELSRLIN